jgi:pimeloyl-ACP methyl ester carboxylesterase
VADAHGATQALGVSLGAATLLRLLAGTPDRFSRVVLFLPAALDRAQPAAVRRSAGLATLLESRDRAAVEAAVRAELPDDLTGTEAYVRARTAFLLRSDLGPLLRALPHEVPVPDPAVLAAVTAQVLVVAQEGDPVHPVAVARAVAAALPGARLEVFARPGVLFRERLALRKLLVDHLGGRGSAAPSG